MIDRIANFILPSRFVYGTNMNDECPISVNKWLSVSLKDPIIEIPYFISNSLYAGVTNNYNSIEVPLIINSNLSARRLIRGAFIDFTHYTGRINGVHMSSGSTYYGAPGIIFNEDMELLLMVTLTMKVMEAQRGTFSVERVNCRISPKVFECQDKIMEKTIVKKIIPFCVSHSIVRRDINIHCNAYNCEAKIIKVIIDDCSSFIHTAAIPKPSTLDKDKIKSFLVENIRDII